MTHLKASNSAIDISKHYIVFPFYSEGKALDGPLWGMTVREAGNMRFRWNEFNPNRVSFLHYLSEGKSVCPIELNHTKDVYVAEKPSDIQGRVGDGIVTHNQDMIPVVTVADCMPLYLYDKSNGAFGIVHSGWKGTGIIEKAVHLMASNYGSLPHDICIALGAHIHDCCYIVNEERAMYFHNNFSPKSIQKLDRELLKTKPKWDNGEGDLYSLSLLEANLSVIESLGIRDENITVLDECTSCNTIFGSNRRETIEGNPFTVQAAFVKWY